MHTHASDQAKIYAKDDRIFLYLSLTFFVFVVGASWHRLFFGANHTDEAAYIAMPYRLFLGDRPLLDEYWISQFAAILLEPIAAAYIKVSGSTDGIILFFRHLYLVFNIITAIVFIRVLADGSETDAPEQELKGLPLWAALLIGSLCVSFVPYGIFNLGYNELAMGLLEIGALLLLLAIIRNKDSDRAQTRRRFLAGLLHGLAIVSYPTLSLGIAIAALLLLSWHQSRWVAFLSYLVGTSVDDSVLLWHATGLYADSDAAARPIPRFSEST